MNCIAHRGFAGVNPENTVPAVAAAAEVADGVEVDVRRCGSGDLVVVHDATVDRVTGASGAVADFTATDLDALSVEGSGAGIPALAAVCEALPADVTLHAELKGTGLADDLCEAVADFAGDVVVSSFEPAALDAVGDRLPTALLVGDAGGAVERAVDLDCDALHPRFLDANEDLITAAHDAGLAVNVWTITDPAEARTLRARGADGVITDYPNCCVSD